MKSVKQMGLALILTTLTGSITAGPLHDAVKADDQIEITRLIAGGARVNARDVSGLTPIFYTIDGSQKETAKLLIRLGAKTNVYNADGNSLLMQAVLDYVGMKSGALAEAHDIKSRLGRLRPGYGYLVPPDDVRIGLVLQQYPHRLDVVAAHGLVQGRHPPGPLLVAGVGPLGE